MRTFSASRIASRPFPLVLSLLLAGALAPRPALAEPAPLRATEPAAKPMAPGAAAPAPVAISRGKVLETMNAANYTYVRVETPAGEKWLAGPQTSVKVGDTVAWSGGSEMKEFPSKSLGRTFDSILFVDRIVAGGGADASAVAAPHGGLSGKAAEAPDVKGIAKAEGGVTIAELYDRRAEFDGKEVVVRGKVVKFNSGVMGRNWIHLRDGTQGSAGDNDLTVTGDGSAAVGDTALVRGKVVLNKDFGFSYRYAVMLESAKITVE